MTSAYEFDTSQWRRVCMALAILLGLVTVIPALAGQDTAASIIGQVQDESGAVLPGVTVTATSPALQVPEVTSVTDERGEYRLTPLPIGTYTVEYALSGFQCIRQDSLRLTVGFVAKLDMVLKVGSLSETVTVSGVSPVVDVTSTATRTAVHAERRSSCSRRAVTASSLDGAGAWRAHQPRCRREQRSATTPHFRAFGQSHESWSTLEGVLSTPPKDTAVGQLLGLCLVRGGAVSQTVGNDAEMPRRGIAMNGIVKSGGNDFHGSAYLGPDERSVSEQQRRRRAAGAGHRRRRTKINKRWDVSGDLGGKIVSGQAVVLRVDGRDRHQNRSAERLQAGWLAGTAHPGQAFRHRKAVVSDVALAIGSSASTQCSRSTRYAASREFVPWESRTDEQHRPHTAKDRMAERAWQRAGHVAPVRALDVAPPRS